MILFVHFCKFKIRLQHDFCLKIHCLPLKLCNLVVKLYKSVETCSSLQSRHSCRIVAFITFHLTRRALKYICLNKCLFFYNTVLLLRGGLLKKKRPIGGTKISLFVYCLFYYYYFFSSNYNFICVVGDHNIGS